MVIHRDASALSAQRTRAIARSQTPSANQGAAHSEVSMAVSSVCDLRVQSDVFGVRVFLASVPRNI